MSNRFPVYGFLFDPNTLGGLSVTVLALLMGDRHLKMFDFFLELRPLNLRVTFINNIWPIPVSFYVGSAALSTSVLASTWLHDFEPKSIAQRCRRQKIRVKAVDYW